MEDTLPSADGVSHNHTLQQWPGTSTKRGEWQTAVSSGGGKFSFGHNDEQAWRPFYIPVNKMKKRERESEHKIVNRSTFYPTMKALCM